MSTKVDIISGFLGSGKTTLIKKLLAESLSGEKVVLIENEFGEIGIDGGFLRDAGIEIREINSGCICCTLVGDFGAALKEVLKRFSPDRVIIEPSGVGKLSDVLSACNGIEGVKVNICATVADALKYKMYAHNFGEFFLDQIEHAKTVILSRTQKTDEDRLAAVVQGIHSSNPHAQIVTTSWEALDGDTILSVAQEGSLPLIEEACSCGHADCGCHSHEHHHHEHGHSGHAADEVFSNWGIETPKIFAKSALESALGRLSDPKYGMVLRAKGIVPVEAGMWVQFDYVPQEMELRACEPDYTGRLCVIGEGLNVAELEKLFGAGA